MEVVVTTGARRRAKLQSNRHRQQTNTQLFTGRMPLLSPNQQCQSTEGKRKLFIQKKSDTRLRPLASSAPSPFFYVSLSSSIISLTVFGASVTNLNEPPRALSCLHYSVG